MSQADSLPSDLNRLTLAQAAGCLAEGHASAVELTEACRFAIKRLQPVLNAFIDLDEEDALDAARKADSERRSDGILNPLHGVPRITRWTRWISYLGLPALALPIGFSDRGMPVAAQIAGRHFDEAVPLSLGAIYQRQTDWHKQEPSLDTGY